jgi:hypothetical protein
MTRCDKTVTHLLLSIGLEVICHAIRLELWSNMLLNRLSSHNSVVVPFGLEVGGKHVLRSHVS